MDLFALGGLIIGLLLLLGGVPIMIKERQFSAPIFFGALFLICLGATGFLF